MQMNFCHPTFVDIEKDIILNTNYCLQLKNGKKELDNKEYPGTILIDLSKAFNTIHHELLIAKLYAYGF